MRRLATTVVWAMVLALAGCQERGDGQGGGVTGSTKPPPVEKPPPAPAVDRNCSSAADCEPVACECSCSGGEGISLREDAVLRKDAERWYKERGCSKPSSCPKVTCPPSRVDCVGGACHVVYGSPTP